MAGGITFQKEVQGDCTLITIRGSIDDSAVLKGLFEAPTPRIMVDLSGITRINSCGIREWVAAVEAIGEDREVEFIRVPRSMVKQFNQVERFGGRGRVVSFFAPYYCSGCDLEESILLSIPRHIDDLTSGAAPGFRCENCGEALSFDDLEERYFGFVLRQEAVTQD